MRTRFPLRCEGHGRAAHAGRPYEGVPGITGNRPTGSIAADPQWYRSFLYAEERARGLDYEEDLAAPGIFTWRSGPGAAVLLLGATGAMPEAARGRTVRAAGAVGARAPGAARRRRCERAADAYIVRRGDGKTIIAGYPWFTDWGRDTFIALRGLCLATGRLADARSILLEWAGLGLRGHAAQPLRGPGRRARVQHGRRLALVRHRGPRLPARRDARRHVPARDRSALRGAVTRDPDRIHAGARATASALDRRRPARRRRAGRAAHLDGRQGGRLGRDASHRQAGGDPGALAERAPDAEGFTERVPRAARARRSRRSTSASGTRPMAASTTWSTPTTRPGNVDSDLRPNQIFAVGGLPLPLAR